MAAVTVSPDDMTKKITLRMRTTAAVRQALLRFMADSNLNDYDAALVQLMQDKGYLVKRRGY